ncbi:MAG: DMT family transporter [Anaerovoracaceae bacterium]|jgi:drug/metabolite transporter (DMT)-like permease
MDRKKLTANFILLFTAFIWGTSFVAQRVGMDYVGPLTFTAIRFLLATLLLLLIVWFTSRRNSLTDEKNDISKNDTYNEQSKKDECLQDAESNRRILFVSGFSCGVILFCGSFMEQFGLVFTTASKASFITALYILLVPLIGLFLKHKIGLKTWFGVIIGTVGLFLLCITETFTIAKGDFIVLIGAVFWACHVLVIDYFLPRIDALKLATFQFGVCSFIAAIGMFLFETPSLQAIMDCAFPIAYAGIVCGGIGFTMQIIGQKNTTPTVAALILSMEAIFGAVSGFILLDETMTPRELTGCLLMVVAIILSQLPDKQEAPLPTFRFKK